MGLVELPRKSRDWEEKGHQVMSLWTFQHFSVMKKQDTARVKKKRNRKSNYEGMATASDRKIRRG